MLKINLSDKQGKKTKETGAETVAEKIVKEPAGQKKKSAARSPLVLVFLIVAIAAAIYMQKDRILSLFPKKVVVQPVPAPLLSEPEVAQKEPDPVFATLNKIGEIMPPMVWLSSVNIKYDGTYEIRGIAFSYSAADSMGNALGGIGNVTAKNIPQKSKSLETVYNLSASGTITGLKIPEILDVMPTDNIVALAEKVVTNSKEYGVNFIRRPESGQLYGENDLPFVLEGSYDGLKKVIADLCPEGGDTRVYQIAILPAITGRLFDRVRASFSLRTISSI